jgi:hypothetical protein
VSLAVGGALVGAGFGIGLVVVGAAWTGRLDRPRRAAASPPSASARTGIDRAAWRLAIALVGLAIAAWWTRWPVAMVALAALGWTAPSFVGLRARRQRQLARSEAVAAWAEMLRDLLVSNAGLHEAIGKSARVAPEAIRNEVAALYVRAQRGELTSALRRFADDVDDPIADTVVVALQLADHRAVSDLGSLLAAVATSTRETVAMQLRVNASRARTYRTAQLITVVVGFFIGLLVATNRDYMAPFGTAAGQVVLAAVVGLVAASVWAMVALSRPIRTERLLTVRTSSAGVPR